MINRLKLLWQAIKLDKRGIDEALETLADIQAFYVARDNFKPEPIQSYREVPIIIEESSNGTR